MTIILDTNPAAWKLLSPTLSLSNAISDILLFINAHLACNYTNQIAVIASHCDKAQWLYPTAAVQSSPQRNQTKSRPQNGGDDDDDDESEDDNPTNRSKRKKLNGTKASANEATSSIDEMENNGYRPFRLVETELVRNLKNLLSSTSPETIQETTSTKIAGALTLALTYTNRRMQEHQESLTGVATTFTDQATALATDTTTADKDALQSRILIVTLSPSTDLAHQYIPIMNSIFACQRLSIPIDVLQLPLPPDPKHSTSQNATSATELSSQSSTVFLQQASDATHGVFIAAKLTTKQPVQDKAIRTSLAQHSMLTYLLTALLPNPTSRLHLITPTRVDVDFRAACFCHRDVISTGFVCSICLSIFCDKSLGVLSEEGCITCGTKLNVRGDGVGGWAGGKKPIVVAPKKKKKKRRTDGLASGVGTPRPATPA